MKFLLCFGTRPEAIKMAPLYHQLKSAQVDFKTVVTAQHREMLDQVLDFFEILPDYDLDLMKKGQSLNELSSLIISEFDKVLNKEKPDLVLVQGDTSTAMIAALAAFHRGIKVGHVEAGLRTFKKLAPFPEEGNRQIISRIADLHFTPTAKAKSNLMQEGICENLLFLTGNTVVDALEWAEEKLKRLKLNEEAESINLKLKTSRKLVLVTGHRRENFGKGLDHICEALLELSDIEGVEIIYPVHMNPNVLGPVKKKMGDRKNIHLIPPVSYPTMLWLMKKSDLIISDSGGIQEEAPTFGKKVLVTRESTERGEGLESGFAILVGTDKNRIKLEAKKVLESPPDFQGMVNPYGDGKAAQKIMHVLLHHQEQHQFDEI